MQGFDVYDRDGNRVTDRRTWLLGSSGTLYYLTADGHLERAGSDFWFSWR